MRATFSAKLHWSLGRKHQGYHFRCMLCKLLLANLASVVHLNPIDPNPAISAHAVFLQSGHIRPEKWPFFQKCPHFSKIKPCKKYEPLIGVQYIKLKLTVNSITRKRNNLVFINQ